MPARMTKQDRIAKERLIYHMWLMEADEIDVMEKFGELIPSAWHTLESDLDCEEPKEKLTLYLDRSVARTFKAMGKGYQARINRLLQTWLALRAAKMLERERSFVRHQDEMMARHKELLSEGRASTLYPRPGELGPTEEPPDVDW